VKTRSDVTKIDRRTFLRQGPLAFLGSIFPMEPEASVAKEETSLPILRPPGAAPEAEFLELCCGVGACAEVCPAQAIRLVPTAEDSAKRAPMIVPNEAPCVVCEGLDCMKACQSGALLPVAREDIQIGFARISPESCVAWEGIDPGCDYCVDRCPLGAAAITMERSGQGKGPVVQKGCVGCGVCEYYCPTHPSAIRVYSYGS
jgi:ferredoxin-type protein NapG